jgi:hypothetical protein
MAPGAALLVNHPDVLVYAEMARWEIQMRQRRARDRQPRHRQPLILARAQVQSAASSSTGAWLTDSSVASSIASISSSTRTRKTIPSW